MLCPCKEAPLEVDAAALHNAATRSRLAGVARGALPSVFGRHDTIYAYCMPDWERPGAEQVRPTITPAPGERRDSPATAASRGGAACFRAAHRSDSTPPSPNQ
mgnify:CR=1 FL=1